MSLVRRSSSVRPECLGENVDASENGPGLHQGAAGADGNGGQKPRGAVARSVVTEWVLAFIQRMHTHVVGQHNGAGEEVGGRETRLKPGPHRVAVSLQLHFFKIERLVARRTGLPGKCHRNEASAGIDFVTQVAFRRQAPEGGHIAMIRIAQATKDQSSLLAILVLDDDPMVSQVDEPTAADNVALTVSPVSNDGSGKSLRLLLRLFRFVVAGPESRSQIERDGSDRLLLEHVF